MKDDSPESGLSRLERDYPEFAALSDWDKQMVVQMRVRLENGGWSGQGEDLMETWSLPLDWLRPNVFFPQGPLEPGWVPCDTKSQEENWEDSGLKCEPYGYDELMDALWEDEEGPLGTNLVRSELGKWAPDRVAELAKLGFDWGVNTWNYPELTFMTMCKKCGCTITGNFDIHNPPDMEEIDWGEEIDWSSFLWIRPQRWE